MVSDTTVVVINTQTGIKTTVKTDSKGFYSFPALDVGCYDLEASQAGFTYTFDPRVRSS